MYCILWEECKQAQCPHRSWKEWTKALMWYYSPTRNKLIYQVRANTYDFWLSCQYGKYHSNIFLFHPLGPFPQKWCVAHLFWSPPSAVHRFHVWDMAVPGLHVSCIWLSAFCLHAKRTHKKWLYCYYMHDANLEYGDWAYFLSNIMNQLK